MSMSTNEGNVTRVTVDLIISGAYREDTTNYICSASNLLNRVTRNVSLIVQCMQVTYAHVLKSTNTLYVTVHAKTSLVRTKIEINFLSPAYSYTH